MNDEHEYQEAIERAAEVLRDAQRPVIMTGAGVSAESGIATFRDPEEGLWAKYDPMELAHIDAFERDPELVTRWYHWRFRKCKDAEPNAGHRAIAELQRRVPGTVLVTQNIDGLHQAAGSEGVIELHGSILRWRCTDTGAIVPIEQIPFEEFPPRSITGGLLRPDVVWFGEMLPPEALEAAAEAVSACDVFMSVGTSSVVYPAAGYAEMAASRGVPTIEVNPEPTPLTARVDVSLRSGAGRAMPDLVRMAFGN